MSVANEKIYDTLICGLVTDGVFSSFDGLWFFASDTAAHAEINLASPSHSLTPHNSPVFTVAVGFTGNGTIGSVGGNMYFDTGLNPGGTPMNFTTNSASVGACITNARNQGAATSFIAIGNESAAGANASYIDPYDGGPTTFVGANELSNANGPSGSVSSAQGAAVASRTGSTTDTFYLNGVSTTAGSGAAGTLANFNMYILALNAAGSPVQFTGDTLAWAFMGAGLSSANQLKVYNRLHTALTSLGLSGC